jgi:hypothetical protein
MARCTPITSKDPMTTKDHAIVDGINARELKAGAGAEVLQA